LATAEKSKMDYRSKGQSLTEIREQPFGLAFAFKVKKTVQLEETDDESTGSYEALKVDFQRHVTAEQEGAAYLKMSATSSLTVIRSRFLEARQYEKIFDIWQRFNPGQEYSTKAVPMLSVFKSRTEAPNRLKTETRGSKHR
jgi:hypothetical protein